jgi:septation ring formation regulator EzrA
MAETDRPERRVPEPKQSETLQQIAQAWEQAKEQFAQLRAEVEKNAKMAMAKQESTFVRRERDQALRDLGEAVWVMVQRGKVALPQQLTAMVKAVEVVEARQKAQQASIADLLKEGSEAADRLKDKRPIRKSPVAAVPKKR